MRLRRCSASGARRSTNWRRAGRSAASKSGAIDASWSLRSTSTLPCWRHEAQREGRTMAGRRGNNEGSIAKRGDGRWQGSVTVEGGKRKYFYGKTRQEVARRLSEALN